MKHPVKFKIFNNPTVTHLPIRTNTSTPSEQRHKPIRAKASAKQWRHTIHENKCRVKKKLEAQREEKKKRHLQRSFHVFSLITLTTIFHKTHRRYYYPQFTNKRATAPRPQELKQSYKTVSSRTKIQTWRTLLHKVT